MGGVVASILFLPGIYAANNAVGKILPTLAVEGIDFDVTSLPQKSTMYASDGQTEIASFYAQNRTVVPIKDISQNMINAVVAREDRRFFEHNGVDVRGVIRAFIQTYIKRGEVQGGSSLTQQYVKNVLIEKAREEGDSLAEYHASEDTIARKLREMLIAVQMEKKYSKMEILQGYLNIAQFGTRSLYGVEVAAHRYFNTTASELSIVQAATIAAITKNPVSYDPSIEENQEESQTQRNITLGLMLQEGYITQAEHDEAVATPLVDTLDLQDVSTNVGCQSAGDAAFFCNYVTKQILNSSEFGETVTERRRLLNEGGLEIYTTMDVTVNQLSMDTARVTIPVDDPSGFEVIMASIRPGTGEVLGFGINRTYDATEAASADATRTAINYAVDQVDGGGMGYQVGSTWKPINLTAWMLADKPINKMLATKTSYNTSEFNCGDYKFANSIWRVQNASGGTVNPESPFLALVRSHNTTQASMATEISLCAIADTAKLMGYHNSPSGQEDVYSSNSFNPPMVIGTVQASPLTMANVYATIAANGVECTPIALTKVTDATGHNYAVPQANCHQAVPAEIAQTVAYTMNQGTVRADGAAYATRLTAGRKTFAKTGTNEDTYLLTGGFVPNEISTFVTVGNAESPVSFNFKTINGRYQAYWFGSSIAAGAWSSLVSSYLDQTGKTVDTTYGQPADKYMGSKDLSSDDEDDEKKEESQEGANEEENVRRYDDGTISGTIVDEDDEYIYVRED